MRTRIMAGVILAGLFGSAALAGGAPSETPQRGAGAGGAGAPADGPSSNQPGSSAQPNAAATSGTGTDGARGNVSVQGSQAR